MGTDGIEKYLKALAHPARRKIIEALAEKKTLSYSELMRITGIEDSGTFAFHLRMLQGLIEKNEVGEYQLTSEGWKAYRALSVLAGREEVRVEERPEEKPSEVMVIQDRINFTLTRKIAEKIRAEGKKILIRDVVFLTIEDMPEELLDEILEGVSDVVFVSIPRKLRDIVELRSKDVLFVGGAVPFIGSIASYITSAITKALASTQWKNDVWSKRENISLSIRRDVPRDYSLAIDLNTSSLHIFENKDNILLLKGVFKKGFEPDVRVSGDRVTVEIDRGKADLEIPISPKTIRIDLNTSSLSGKIGCKEKVFIDSNTSRAELELVDLKTTNIGIDSNTSSINIKAIYDIIDGEAEVKVDSNTSSISFEIEIPEETKVDAEINGYGIIEINGVRTRSYRDKGYDESPSRLRVRVDNDAGSVKVVIKRRLSS